MVVHVLATVAVVNIPGENITKNNQWLWAEFDPLPGHHGKALSVAEDSGAHPGRMFPEKSQPNTTFVVTVGETVSKISR